MDVGENLVIALVTGAVTLAVCLVSNFFQQSKTRALLEYKLNELTQRVNLLEGKEECGC